MSLEYLLKSSRESANLTQEAAADKLEVSVNTISNWETGAVTPSARDWKNIAEIYGISRDDFLKACNDKVWPPDEEVPDDFPSFLFSDERMKTISKLVFTPQETELIRMLTMYCNSTLQEKDLHRLPYAYVNRVTIAKIYEMVDSILHKIDWPQYDNGVYFYLDHYGIWDCIVDELKYPKSHEPIMAFNIFKLPIDSLMPFAELPKVYYPSDSGMCYGIDYFNTLLQAVKTVRNKDWNKFHELMRQARIATVQYIRQSDDWLITEGDLVTLTTKGEQLYQFCQEHADLIFEDSNQKSA